ncbi:histone-lysine N-methyltransferase SETMAR isoform 3-T3 [Morphnus guianensis]
MADLSGGLEPVAVGLWPPGEAPPAFQYSPDNVAGPDGDIDPTEISFPGCSCLTSSCMVHTCSCLRLGENYNSLCLRPTGEEEEYTRPVFECNAMCQCGESCQNRVVQRGLQLRLEKK